MGAWRLVPVLVMLATPVARAGDPLSVGAAYERATRGEIILIDVRSPQEWRETGVASVARPLSMHERDFLTHLHRISVEAGGRPLALICATGGRSAWLVEQLDARGFPGLINVPEGMLGSAAGPGWIRAGLPVRAWGAGPVRGSSYSLWERLTGNYRPPWLDAAGEFAPGRTRRDR